MTEVSSGNPEVASSNLAQGSFFFCYDQFLPPIGGAHIVLSSIPKQSGLAGLRRPGKSSGYATSRWGEEQFTKRKINLALPDRVFVYEDGVLNVNFNTVYITNVFFVPAFMVPAFLRNFPTLRVPHGGSHRSLVHVYPCALLPLAHFIVDARHKCVSPQVYDSEKIIGGYTLENLNMILLVDGDGKARFYCVSGLFFPGVPAGNFHSANHTGKLFEHAVVLNQPDGTGLGW
ncbi:uncharacterized protein EDB91DRAFT_1088002 [Suillus paluster]|uniref:uncharacterized protein n=1 Tax=Suillus paluster TaxID=48578 RepID=UPI001B874C46|nr:uncharacterized protein EDB91DRAFT_1088002 [Suillus paluster]KAG1722785.1 hypothetical protein EDB91DRAFT_1088002 [Suillus paluster]